jgi:hypothetical protein
MPNKALKDNVTRIQPVLNCGSHGPPYSGNNIPLQDLIYHIMQVLQSWIANFEASEIANLKHLKSQEVSQTCQVEGTLNRESRP